MNLIKAKDNLRLAAELVERMAAEGLPSAIERDLALQHLREAYGALLGAVEREAEPAAAACAVPEEERAVAPEHSEPADEEECEEDCIVELIFSEEEDGDDAFEEEPEPEPEPEQNAEPESVEPEPEPAVESEEPQSSLFGDDILLHKPARRSVLVSLYDDEPPVQPEHPSAEHPSPAPVPTPTPTPVSGSILGEVLGSDAPTIGDSMPRREDISASAPVASLREAIGVNDRFLLLRDLFGGDERAYDEVIGALDAQPSLDDCMIYIVENCPWPSTSAGAALIMELLQRKFR